MEIQLIANPSNIFKMLRKTGKRAGRKSERPNIVKQGEETTSDPKIVAEKFHEVWNGIYSNEIQEKEEGEWLKHIKKGEHSHQLRVVVDDETL